MTGRPGIPAPAGGMVVALSSSNTAAATLLASVTVPAGASTAVTITASSGGVTRTVALTVSPQPADTVSVTRAEYTTPKKELRVEATGTNGTASLKVYVAGTNEPIGTLTNNGADKHSGQFSWPVNPQTILVRSSSLGGSATRTVTAK
jgi:hypothetical protein